MTSPSRLGRIADDAIVQMVAQGFFTTSSLGTTASVTPQYAYVYSFDIPSTNFQPQVIVAPLDVNPLREGWGGENTHLRLGFGFVARVKDYTDRTVLDPYMACVENMAQYLMGANKFDVANCGVECISASAAAGIELSEELRSKNTFLVVLEAEFQDHIVVTYAST